MAAVTTEIREKVSRIAWRMTRNNEDYLDAVDVGLMKICEMVDGHTTSYYVQYAYRRIQDFLRKERLYHRRHVLMDDDGLEQIENNKLFGGRVVIPSYPETE